jgi:surfeit locus 1 family protein
MRVREYVLIVVAIVAAVVCTRLGIWQLHRLQERKARNAMVASRLNEAPVSLAQLPRDTGALRYRRVPVKGVYDYAHQIILTTRTYNGSPGVYILTPVHMAGTDTALLVNRGWVYSPDGVHVDLKPWQEGDSINALAYAEPFGRPRRGPAESPTRDNAFHWIDARLLPLAFPYPVFPFLVVLEGDSVTPPHVPPRVPPPALDEGPHLSYAIQWFAFTLIAIIGIGFFIRKTLQQRTVQDE